MKSTIALYRVAEVESFLLGHPKGFDFKQGHELLCGCILAKQMMTGPESNVGVGFRLSDSQEVRSNHRPPLAKLLTDFKIDDRDIDILVGNDDWASPIQVTRLVREGRGLSPEDRLKTLLSKKMMVQTDPKLILAILMDETFELVYDNICEYISEFTIPYGRIYLIGQTGVRVRLGEFNCIEIYPELTISTALTVLRPD